MWRPVELIAAPFNLMSYSYALVLSATLLTGGRIADIFSSKWTFIAGFTALGVFNILLGFISKSPITPTSIQPFATTS